MGLQLLELIRVPLPSLDFGLRQSALAFDGGRRTTSRGGSGGSLFDENGGLILGTRDIIHDEAKDVNNDEENYYTGVLFRMFLLGGTSALVASPCATPVLTSLLAYLASASTTSSSTTSSMAAAASSGNVWTGASWMLSYTLGYSTPLLVVGATGGQALVNLRKARETNDGFSAMLGQWVNPITGGVLIAFGMNGLLVALLGDPSVSALAPIID
jgi:cytochrome c-type biogenesis protein